MIKTLNWILIGLATLLTIALIAIGGYIVLKEETKNNVTQIEIPTGYPINLEINSYIGEKTLESDLVPDNMGDKLISVLHKVSYDEDTKYNYSYKISYLGKEKVFFFWETLSSALSTQNIESSMLELEPGKTLEIQFNSEKGPEFHTGKACLYKKTKLQKNDVWILVPLKAQPGPLPK